MIQVPRYITRNTLGAKLRWANLVTSGAVILLSTVLLLAIQLYFFITALVSQTQAEANLASENMSAAIAFDDKLAASEILGAFRVVTGISHAAVFDRHDRLFADYKREANTVDDASNVLEGGKAYSPSLMHVVVRKQFDLQGEKLGTIVIQSDLADVYEQLTLYLLIIVPVMGGVLFLANLVLSRLQKHITEPIASLATVSTRISDLGDYSMRARTSRLSDIGALSTAFNSMLERIQHREAELKSEIAERKRVEEKLDRLAHFDNVTELNNRHFFNERLHAIVSRSEQSRERTGLMFIDLDNFKAVNDTLGHDTGDELLRLVSKRLSDTLRFGDVICRIGGDEFAIILENIPQASVASMVAEKCLASLAMPISTNGNEIYISASIGISIYPDDARDMHELLKYADTAMYYAKNGGKNAFRLFLPSMQGEAQKRFSMDTNLRRALERDEFRLHYQTQIDLGTSRIIGVEALIRWAHPDLGMISPAEFIPIAEETGLIVPIGEWVLREACNQMKQWHDEGMVHLRIAVNLSSRQLKEDNFVETVLKIVEETGINPKLLELELTESMLMDVESSVIDKLYALRSAGISLAIDDFGTGYSSMSYLKTFPINCIKIDRSFVSDLPQNLEDAAITKAIIAMAKALKMQVIAEGIENLEQGHFLRDNGCDMSQGYYYSKPAPAEHIRSMLFDKIDRMHNSASEVAGQS